MKAVILAAGKGTRMLPLTQNQPKPMIPIANRRLIEWILAALKQSGITEVCIVTGYLAPVLEAYLGDGSTYDLRIHYQRQIPQNGTAGGLLCAETWTAGEPFLLTFSDILFHYQNYSHAINTFHHYSPDILLTVNWMEDPYLGAAVYWDQDSYQITNIQEKPPKGTSTTHWNQAGFFVFTPTIFDYLHRLNPSPRGEYELTEAISHSVCDKMHVQALPVQHFRFEVTTPEDVAWLESQNKETIGFLENNVLG